MWITHSLRFRLLLVVVMVMAGTVTLAAWFASQAITSRFEDFVVQEQERFKGRNTLLESVTAELLALYYQPGKGWPADIDNITAELSEFIGYRIILKDANDNILADSVEKPTKSGIEQANLPYIVNNDGVVGVVTVQLPTPTVDVEREQAFLDSVTRSLMLAVLIAGSLAIILILVLAHPMLNVIEELTRAARSMALNNRAHRVAVRSNDEIGELAHSFNQMAESLERMDNLRQNVVSDIAHELRTPLSNIRGYMEALRDEVIPPNRNLFESLCEQSVLLSRLVDDLQELALAEAGRLNLLMEPLEISDVVNNTVSSIQKRAQEARVVVRASLPRKLPNVCGDVDRIGQILLNLLKNGITYTQAGGQVVVKGYYDDDYVTLLVVDNGQGIEAEHLAHVFDRFYRVDRSRTRATGGSGLGLAIVKQLVEAQGGKVWAESKPGLGSTFAFTLPRAI